MQGATATAAGSRSALLSHVKELLATSAQDHKPAGAVLFALKYSSLLAYSLVRKFSQDANLDILVSVLQNVAYSPLPLVCPSSGFGNMLSPGRQRSTIPMAAVQW